jgi:hypothetical protein
MCSIHAIAACLGHQPLIKSHRPQRSIFPPSPHFSPKETGTPLCNEPILIERDHNAWRRARSLLSCTGERLPPLPGFGDSEGANFSSKFNAVRFHPPRLSARMIESARTRIGNSTDRTAGRSLEEGELHLTMPASLACWQSASAIERLISVSASSVAY